MPRNLSVPDSAESVEVREGNFSGMGPNDKPRSSVSITPIAPPAGADNRNSYKPSASKSHAIAVARGEASPKVRSNETPGRIQKIYGATYMSASDTAKRIGVVDSEVLALAKELWEEDRDARNRFNQAKKIVKGASEEEIERPKNRLAKAIKIIERGVLSKKKAKVEARNRITRSKSKGRL